MFKYHGNAAWQISAHPGGIILLDRQSREKSVFSLSSPALRDFGEVSMSFSLCGASPFAAAAAAGVRAVLF